MAVFQRILFPVDFSARCRSAAPFVRMMAERCNAQLTVLHVIELPVSVYTTIGYETVLDLPAIQGAARASSVRVVTMPRPIRAQRSRRKRRQWRGACMGNSTTLLGT